MKIAATAFKGFYSGLICRIFFDQKKFLVLTTLFDQTELVQAQTVLKLTSVTE